MISKDLLDWKFYGNIWYLFGGLEETLRQESLLEKVCGGLVSKLCLTLATTWTVACQTPPSMGFSRQEYWSGCHFLLQGIFPTQGLNPGLLHSRQILYWLNDEGNSQRKNVELIYNVVLVSGIQQSYSLYIFFSRFFSIIGYYRILAIVPCAVQWALVVYLFFIVLFLSISSSLFIPLPPEKVCFWQGELFIGQWWTFINTYSAGAWFWFSS